MRTLVFFLLVVGLHGIAFAQDGQESELTIVTHEVKAGETIRMLSLKYLATPSDIYQLNKFAINGISQGMILHIPTTKKRVAPKVEKAPIDLIREDKPIPQDPNIEVAQSLIPVSQNTAKHIVVSGETLTAIAKRYGLTVAQLKSQNEKVLQRGLQAGNVLIIGSQSQTESDSTAASSTVGNNPDTGQSPIEHTVESKETLYSISKKYDVTVDQIRTQNPSIVAHGLQAGQVIKIKPNN